LFNFGATSNRTFEVNIEPSGGGAPLQTDVILTALAGTTALPDSGGNLLGTVNISSFSGQAVRISFDWVVPQNFTGPAFCQLDNITTHPSNPIPTLSEWGMILTGVMLGIIALITLRKRRALRV
jgi:hypothetical protein